MIPFHHIPLIFHPVTDSPSPFTHRLPSRPIPRNEIASILNSLFHRWQEPFPRYRIHSSRRCLYIVWIGLDRETFDQTEKIGRSTSKCSPFSCSWGGSGMLMKTSLWETNSIWVGIELLLTRTIQSTTSFVHFFFLSPYNSLYFYLLLSTLLPTSPLSLSLYSSSSTTLDSSIQPLFIPRFSLPLFRCVLLYFVYLFTFGRL